MGTMNDLFVRGEPFNGDTGEKTGAQLEDMVARAYPAASSQLVDQSTLETYSDATVTDDDGNAINRIRAKADGIGTSQIAAESITRIKLANELQLAGGTLLTTIFGSAAAAAAAMATSGTWTVAPTDVANIFDIDNATSWGSSTRASSTNILVYWDLGAVYQGNLFVMVDMRGGSWVRVSPLAWYDSIFTNATWGGESASRGVRIESSAAKTVTAAMAFYGRYVGLQFVYDNGSNGYFDVRRFEAAGVAV